MKNKYWWLRTDWPFVFFFFSVSVVGVYVPPGAGIGPGGVGPGTGYFPGNKASNVCLDSLNKNNPEHSHNKQSLFLL